MPIGKNAIKRVENNGYSKVESSAPDMENSVVAPAAVETSAEETAISVAPAAPAKPRRGRPAKIKTANETKETFLASQMPVEATRESVSGSKSRTAKKTRTAPFKAVKKDEDGFERIELGGEMPYWLL